MKSNGHLYSDSINREIGLLSGEDHVQRWEQCFQTNTSYVDCPTAKFARYDVGTMDIAVHNPSSIDTNTV